MTSRRTLRPRAIARDAWQEVPGYVPSSSPVAPVSRRLACSADVWAACADIVDASQEHAIVFALNARHVVASRWIAGIGSVSGVLLGPREVYRRAVISNATAIIVAHNHPSGDPSPSEADKRITTMLRQAGDILDIPLLDHVIVVREGYTSFADRAWSP